MSFFFFYIIISKCLITGFTTDKTLHQTELPSTSSPDRLAWSTKHNSVWLPLKSVFFYWNSCYLIFCTCVSKEKCIICIYIHRRLYKDLFDKYAKCENFMWNKKKKIFLENQNSFLVIIFRAWYGRWQAQRDGNLGLFVLLVCQFTTLLPTEISQRLLNGLARNFAQIFIFYQTIKAHDFYFSAIIRFFFTNMETVLLQLCTWNWIIQSILFLSWNQKIAGFSWELKKACQFLTYTVLLKTGGEEIWNNIKVERILDRSS